ncbi:hypothetical protein ND748_15370 [Frankia sp. AiPs1]|uniref:hypothetical protein n=1 Tax=Frankia sp. AiPs1 TaxID=573493 RepID=UPI002044B04E|nr:hypothetical protein [Frankia sp. AiPs1]MCM3923036.1 hypothetical protein [Frankia sp. AiPs1]
MVDGANVIGSRADGWWRDRPGAARRLLADISAWIAGSDGHVGSPGSAEWPTGIVVVLEGAARAGVPAAVVVVEPTPAKPLAPDDDQVQVRGSTDQPNGNTDQPNGNTGQPNGNTGRPCGKDGRSTGTGDRSARKADHRAENGDRRAEKGRRSPADGNSNSGNGADRSDATNDDGPALAPTLAVVHAPGNGDDAIVDAARRAGPGVIVITSDRGLTARVRALGAEARGAGWLWDRLRR